MMPLEFNYTERIAEGNSNILFNMYNINAVGYLKCGRVFC